MGCEGAVMHEITGSLDGVLQQVHGEREAREFIRHRQQSLFEEAVAGLKARLLETQEGRQASHGSMLTRCLQQVAQAEAEVRESAQGGDKSRAQARHLLESFF